MKLTNKFGAPEPIVRAVKRHIHHVPGDISVTQLIQPVRIRQLALRHDDEIEEDVSDRIWMLLGRAVHAVLREAAVPNALQEEILCVEVPGTGWRLSGTPDLYTEWAPSGSPRITSLSDYKLTSVWAVLDGVKPEWEAQVNVYRWLWYQYTFDCDRLEVVALFRDWQKVKAYYNGGNYPSFQWQHLPVRMWPLEKTLGYIQERIALHQFYQDISDDGLPVCTPQERWQRTTQWAVMQKGRKSAVRVKDTLKEAADYMAQSGKEAQYIEERHGKSARCGLPPEGYCNVSPWCNRYQNELKKEKR